MLEKLLHTEGIEIVLRDMAQSWQKLRGGKFQLQYFADHLAEGTSIVKFEVREEIKVGEKTVARIYDIVTESDLGPINYELKNWSGWQSWSSKAFRDQFLKDLSTMAKGKRVKWVFSGHKMNREEIKRKVIGALQDDKWKAQLTSMIQDLSDKSSLETIFGAEIGDAESLIKAIDEHDTIFDFLFEITKQ